MAIALSPIFEDVATDIGVGTGSDRLAGSFVRAVNRTVDQMSIKADLASRISHVSSTDGTINIDEEYEYIIVSGIFFWLYRTGYKPKDPRIAPVVLKDTQDAWEEALADYVMAEDNEAQSDSTNDNWGFGALS